MTTGSCSFRVWRQAFCPKCSREIRPETVPSIVKQIFAAHAGKTLLVTFGVPAPPGTKPADFFDFLKQQGYLSMWLDGEIARADEPVKTTRLPAIVPVIQDRVTLNEEGRSRLTEAIEVALRFGKGKIAVNGPGCSSLFRPGGIAPTAISILLRRPRGCLVSITPMAPALPVADLAAPLPSICSGPFLTDP